MSDETTLSREQIEEIITTNMNNLIDRIVEQNESASQATSERIQGIYDFVVEFTNNHTAINERVIESLRGNAQHNDKLEHLSNTVESLTVEIAKLHRQTLTQRETHSKIFGIIASVVSLGLKLTWRLLKLTWRLLKRILLRRSPTLL